MKQLVATRGLVVMDVEDDIATGILTKAMVARGCNWVDTRLGLHKRDEPNIKWGRYKYIFISPHYYEVFKASMEKLEGRADVYVAICSMSNPAFKELKKKHGVSKNGAAKVLYICTKLFSLCVEIQE